MDSSVVRIVESAGFKNVNFLSVFLAVSLTLCAGVAWKLVRRRAKYAKYKDVSRKMGLFDLWGSLRDYIYNPKKAGLPFNVYVLQVMMGYSQLFKEKNFFYFWLSYWPFVIATKAKAVEELISGSKNMEKNWFYRWLHPWLGTGLLTSTGAKWKSRRKLLTPAFHFEILKDFLPVFNEQSHLLVAQLLEQQAKQPWIDIIKPITLCSLDIVCETTLGVSIGAQKDSESEYVQAVSRAANMVMQRFVNPLYMFDWIFNITPDGFQFKKDVKLLHDFTRKAIADKKAKLLSGNVDTSKKRKALMDLLLEQHVLNKALSEEDIREEVDTFAFEGHDTTSMGMSWALYLIGLHKDVQEKVHEELDRIFGDDFERDVTTDDLRDMEYLDRILKESQRLYPSVPFLGRTLSCDLNICGIKVPKEVGGVVLVYALHRDESVFPNPEKFDPDRFLPENSVNRHPYAYIPFSAGPRNCIGQRFAIMEEKVVLSNVLRNFSVKSLDPRDKVIMNPELILRAADDIRVQFKPRRPTSSH